MSRKVQIKYIINPKTGEMRVETDGYQGKECIEAVEKVGVGKSSAIEFTQDYYKRPDDPKVRIT